MLMGLLRGCVALLGPMNSLNFVSFSLDFWEDMWQSRHQIMLELSQQGKVLFVSRPFSLRELFEDRGTGKLPASGLVKRSENLYSLVFPKWLSEIYRYPSLRRLLERARAAYVRRAIRKLGIEKPVLFVWNPHFLEFVGTLKESLVCYYVDDEFSSYAGLTEPERKSILEREDQLLRIATVAFANGGALRALKNTYGNVIDVPMSADFSLFSQSRNPETRVPEDLAKLPHPRVGYVGNINDKIDVGLLADLAKARPDWHFPLIGPVSMRTPEYKADLRRLESLPNVYFLGLKTRQELPSYIKGFDVCLMPYRTSGWAYYVYPLKLHEYLASGKPAVGSALTSLQPFEGLIRIGRSPEEWLSAIQDSLEEKDDSLGEKRVQVAYENRVEARVKAILEAIREKLDGKAAGSDVPGNLRHPEEPPLIRTPLSRS